jgi:transcriptional regulator
MFAKDSGLLQGTLELLVLKTLSWGPMHGYAVASWIERATDDVLRVEEGSLYPALYRMTRKGWIAGEWGVSENNRRAKFYRLTTEGREQLREQGTGWARLAAAVTKAMTTTTAPTSAPSAAR